MPSYVTDRAHPALASNAQSSLETDSLTSEATNKELGDIENAVASTSATVISPISSYSPSTSGLSCLPTPEQLLPFEKAEPRKESRKGKKRRKTAILTDTPIKEALRKE